MYKINNFDSRELLDSQLADNVANILNIAVRENGKASIAVSGGSTPKGFFDALSKKKLPWDAITITLADERWVDIEDSASNTKLVHESLIQNEAVNANFFHLKQGAELSHEVLSDLNLAVKSSVLPFDVLILGMGEDGHTASLFPCSDEIHQCLAMSTSPLLKVKPKTAPHQRISFSFAYLKHSRNTFLHICGDGKKQVLDKALQNEAVEEMPIRAFLHAPDVNTQIFWAE